MCVELVLAVVDLSRAGSDQWRRDGSQTRFCSSAMVQSPEIQTFNRVLCRVKTSGSRMAGGVGVR